MKYDLDAKNRYERQNIMHWNVDPDALPVSARLARILDCWCNNCIAVLYIGEN